MHVHVRLVRNYIWITSLVIKDVCSECVDLQLPRLLLLASYWYYNVWNYKFVEVPDITNSIVRPCVAYRNNVRVLYARRQNE